MNFYETMYVVHPALQAGRLDDMIQIVDKKVKELKELVSNKNNKIETVKTIPVEESILYPPDENLLLASIWTYKEDKIENNRIQLYSINQTGYELKW